MPLIIVTGCPSSGKTTLAKQLLDYFRSRLKQEDRTNQVKLVTDEDKLDWEGRDNIYMSIPKEKELRAWLRSEAQRFVNLNQIVILDAAAYIKGYRYELFCMSKEAKTQYCVVEKSLDSDVCWEWNKSRLEAYQGEDDEDGPKPGYSRETFDALLMRYEKCNETNRWDSPMFCLSTPEEELDFNKVYHIIVEGERLKPNKCTSLIHTQ